jgi:hypothetical protein
MPAGPASNDSTSNGPRKDRPSGDAPPSAGFWERFLVAMPRLRRGSEKEPLGDRLRRAMLKPTDPSSPGTTSPAGKGPTRNGKGPNRSGKGPTRNGKGPSHPAGRSARPEDLQTPEELEYAVRYADDKERLIGLVAAPLAAAVGLVIVSVLISNDPAATLHGSPNPKHVSVSLYHELLIVLLALSVAMMAAAWFRKRLFVGIAMALYGLTVFNLHYWGFGIPFVLGGAWYLVRAFRLNRALREATGDLPGRPGPNSGRPSNRSGTSKRYTPPGRPRRPPSPRKPK